MIKVNLDAFNEFYTIKEYEKMLKKTEKAHQELFARTGRGNEFLGWIDLPKNIEKDLADIENTANKIKQQSEILIVIGIGGSSLGAKSAIEFMISANYNMLNRNGWPQIFFVGDNMSYQYLEEISEIMQEKDFSVNYISKSGSTIEPAIAYHYFEQKLKLKYGEKFIERVYVTTDEKVGELRKYEDKNKVKSFEIGADVCGRFSVLSAVGLLPIACAGLCVRKIIDGAKSMRSELEKYSAENIAIKYTVARNLAYENGKSIELLGSYEPSLAHLTNWWKQLFGESEGKECKGIFPTTMSLTTDLHSIGQYIQDGSRNIFETIIHIAKNKQDYLIENTNKDFGALKIFEGLKMSEINEMAMKGTIKAHNKGGVPNILIEIEDNFEKTYGELVYFFEIACGLSGYVLGVNPFDQPGVEAYKQELLQMATEKGVLYGTI